MRKNWEWKNNICKNVAKRKKMIVLSCDDFVLAVNDDLCKRHEIQKKVSMQLFALAKQIWSNELSVILDFGFWYKEQRKK